LSITRVDDHLGDLGLDRDGIRGDLGDAPGELLLARQLLRALVGADRVQLHRMPS
jgi:hypothetical protein